MTTTGFLLAVLLVTLQSPVPGTAPPAVPFGCKVAHHHRLVLLVPEPWHATASDPVNGAVTIRVTSKGSQDFILLLTALEPDKASAKLLDEEGIKLLVTMQGAEMLPTAVETELKLLRVEGGAGVGYFYVLTDRREVLPEGEYRYVCQGVMAVGRLSLSVTLLTHRPTEDLMRAFFRLLKGATEK